MKKLILICGFMTIGLIAAQAQDKGSVRANVGFVYDTDIEELGLNFGVEYFITDKIAVSPNYSTFFVDGPVSFSALNIDGRYYFINSPVQAYGLFGFALRFIDVGLFDDTDGGLNFGGGVHVPLGGRFSIHSQLKYTTAYSGALTMLGGVAYRIK